MSYYGNSTRNSVQMAPEAAAPRTSKKRSPTKRTAAKRAVKRPAKKRSGTMINVVLLRRLVRGHRIRLAVGLAVVVVWSLLFPVIYKAFVDQLDGRPDPAWELLHALRARSPWGSFIQSPSHSSAS